MANPAPSSAAPRLPYRDLAPELTRALGQVHALLLQSSLGQRLLALIDLRVSQLNGCAFCVDMHARELLAQGDDLQRLNSLVTWRETDLFDARERAALHWAERCTRLNLEHPGQADFDALRPHFSDREIAELGFAVASINAWNRLGVGFQLPVARRALQPQG